MECPICGNDEKNLIVTVKEMQIGLREEFEYIECFNCGCLFIKDIPEDIGKYYDENYAPHLADDLKNKIMDYILSKLYANDYLTKLLFKNKVSPFSRFFNNLVNKNIITKDSFILDVGCGNGKLLNILKLGGFSNLTGVDLFVDEKNMLENISIFATSLEKFQTKKKYDLIMSHHSFEHMDNQLINLKCMENLVKDDGLIIIRIPIKSKYFWDKYGVNWYQIDAPRHFFLHTIESFKILCDKTNLCIEDIIFDSNKYIFTNCEKYSQNISMRDDEWNKIKISPKKDKEYEKLINYLNKTNNADQAMFILRLNNK